MKHQMIIDKTKCHPVKNTNPRFCNECGTYSIKYYNPLVVKCQNCGTTTYHNYQWYCDKCNLLIKYHKIWGLRGFPNIKYYE